MTGRNSSTSWRASSNSSTTGAPTASPRPITSRSSPASASARPAPEALPLSDSLTGSAQTDYESGRILFQDGDFAVLSLESIGGLDGEPIRQNVINQDVLA